MEGRLSRLEDLKAKVRVEGLVAGSAADVIAVEWFGADTVEVTFRSDDGVVGQRLLSRVDERRLVVVAAERPWTLDADGDLFKLASEARRIQLAYQADPFIAVETSTIDPLPHQIEAVYQRMLPVQPLRFLLADDPGAGKTIMAGLYIRELVIRGDVERCLIVAPGSLVEQWQDEMREKFGLRFTILSRDLVEASASGNPFREHRLLIVRVHQLSRNPDLLAKLEASDWDLVIVDEAHKMAAHVYAGETKRTLLFQLGEALGGLTRHLLLLTATPHNGKDEDFQMFMSLLDPDRFAGARSGSKLVKADTSDLMRRYVKESLKTFEGKRLFTERIATTVNYELSAPEHSLYEAVTNYVRIGMDAAKRLEEGGDRKRGLVVGFALAALQRRLASSPEAIYRSLQRRRERLEKRRAELAAIAAGVAHPKPSDPLAGVAIGELEEFDFDAWDDVELEEIEDEAIDQATAAATVAELSAEIVELGVLERLAAAVRHSRQDTKWVELRGILQSPVMTADDGTKRKLIVFTEHKDTLNYLVERIRSTLGRAEAVVAIHGGVGREERRRAQEAFTKVPEVQVLVATDAAGEGVNLQRANLMVNYDLPWNPNRIEQRFGRIHRIGQKEVCHLWNLVAYKTREGQVFDRLFTKLEEMRKALGDQVYDVLGDAEINRSLSELLVEAIRYGEQPAVRARMEEVIDRDVGHRLQEALSERALSSDLLPHAQVIEIRDAMEKAKARRLQPGFVAAFFKAAFAELGGRIVERETARYEITRVPASVRSRDREVAVGAPIQPAYERVVFDPALIHQDGKPPADLAAPGHPLLTATIDAMLERHGPLLRRGAILVDPSDPGLVPRALVYLEHSISDGAGRNVSSRFQFVEIGEDGTIADPGGEPYLDYRAVTEQEQSLLMDQRQAAWLTESLNETARRHAIAALAAPHFDEVRRLTEARIDRIRRAVEERLDAEARRWDAKAAELKTKELQGKKGRGGITSGHARNKADEMQARKDKRLRELDRERDLQNKPPIVVAGALVVPQGLLDQIQGAPTPKPTTHAVEVEEVDRRAIAAVLAAERSLGRIPEEMPHNNPGYDIESLDPDTGRRFFIEVKGRIEGRDTVSVKVRQIRMAVNNPDAFILVVVLVPFDVAAPPEVRYVMQPFEGPAPGFAEVSRTYSIPDLWKRGVAVSAVAEVEE